MKKMALLFFLAPHFVYALGAPAVNISTQYYETSVIVSLTWEEVTDAEQYCVYSRGEDPWGEAAPDCDYASFQPEEYCIGWTTSVCDYFQGISALGLYNMARKRLRICG